MEINNRITILANFRIDSRERLKRMKESFSSFSDANIDTWIINIRGPLRLEAENFLKLNVKQHLKTFKKESKLGWKYDTKLIAQYINTSHVMYWVEDHICIGGYNKFNEVINEIIENKIDYLCYSWFKFGSNLKTFSKINYESKTSIISLNYDKKKHYLRSKYINEVDLEHTYLISLCSITSKELFIDLISIKDPWISRWSSMVPFDFEKNQYDIHWLPFKLGVLKQEVFASIDDDNNCIGSSLVSRGLYHTNISRKDMLDNRNKSIKSEARLKKQILKYYILNVLYFKIVKFIKILIESINSYYAKFFFMR